MLEARGIPVLHADRAGHEVIAPGGAAESAVIKAFGKEILTGGAIDRSKLGAVVFSQPDARQRLNAIVHPIIRQELNRQCEELAAQGHGAAVIEAALFGENKDLEPPLDGLILVLAARETRIRRLMRDRGLTEEEAAQRVDSQRLPEEKLALAAWVLENDGSIEQLRGEVDALYSHMGL